MAIASVGQRSTASRAGRGRATACRRSGRQALASGQAMWTALSGVHSSVLRVVTGSGDKAACQDTRPASPAGPPVEA
jgi:hypothetical protein